MRVTVDIGSDDFGRPAAGAETEIQFPGERCFSDAQIVFGFLQGFCQRIGRGGKMLARHPQFIRDQGN